MSTPAAGVSGKQKAEAGSGDAGCVVLSAELAEASLDDVETLLSDGDGALGRSETAASCAPSLLTALQAGERLGFITNNSSETLEACAAELRRLGFGRPAGLAAAARSSAWPTAPRSTCCSAGPARRAQGLHAGQRSPGLGAGGRGRGAQAAAG